MLVHCAVLCILDWCCILSNLVPKHLEFCWLWVCDGLTYGVYLIIICCIRFIIHNKWCDESKVYVIRQFKALKWKLLQVGLHIYTTLRPCRFAWKVFFSSGKIHLRNFLRKFVKWTFKCCCVIMFEPCLENSIITECLCVSMYVCMDVCLFECMSVFV